MPNGRSGGKRRSRRTKRNKDEKGGRTVNTAAPALFAFMGSLSSSVGLSAWRWACAVPRCGSRCFRNGQRKAIIRTHRLSETGSDYIGLVREAGVEPARPCEHWHLKPASLPIPPLARTFGAVSAQVVCYHRKGKVSILFFKKTASILPGSAGGAGRYAEAGRKPWLPSGLSDREALSACAWSAGWP